MLVEKLDATKTGTLESNIAIEDRRFFKTTFEKETRKGKAWENVGLVGFTAFMIAKLVDNSNNYGS